MNLGIIKKEMENMIGQKVEAKIYIGRNKYEIFEGQIDEVYPYLFTIKRGDETKSFSYADILTKNIMIKTIEKN